MQNLMLTAQSNPIQVRLNRLMFWYAFLMAFPTILIIQNISVYLFPLLIFAIYELTGRIFVFRHFIQFISLLFGIGAIISVLNMPDSMSSANVMAAISVLPNYLYWVLLLLFFTSFGKQINLPEVYRGIYWGIIFSILYFFIFQKLGATGLPFFKVLSQNTFAFLLICFTPLVVWYINFRYGFWSSVLALVILTAAGFLSGSRSGSLLTLSGGALTLLLNRRSVGGILIIGLLVYFIIVAMINTVVIKSLVRNLNMRTFSLVYDTKTTLEEDRSYLTRLAQVEKGLLIAEKYPLSGIGLNNFPRYKVKLPGNFEGAEFVINKKSIDSKSAHNSYIGFLAEGGLVLLIPFIALLLYCIIWFFLHVKKLRPEYKPIFIGIIHMSIHLYFIYAILNVFAWFLIALGCFVIVNHKR